MAAFDDPLEAAKRRLLPQRANQSFFPAANLNQFSDPTSGSIFKPGFDPDNPLGQPTPAPTPKPTPAPRSFFGGVFQLPTFAGGGVVDPSLQGREREIGPITPAEMNQLWQARQRANEAARARVMNEVPVQLGMNQPQRLILGRPPQYDTLNKLYGWA